jgi:hypothetical protein
MRSNKLKSIGNSKQQLNCLGVATQLQRMCKNMGCKSIAVFAEFENQDCYFRTTSPNRHETAGRLMQMANDLLSVER